MNPVRKTASAGNGHIAAIHILKAQLQMTDADYRVLLDALTTQISCKDMTDKQLQQVRAHMHGLAVKAGLAKPQAYVRFSHVGKAASKTNKKPLEPLERKVWALWYALESAQRISTAPNSQARAKALRAYVTRQTGVADMAFCSNKQLNSLVEAMKKWLERGKDEQMEAAT